MAYEYTPAYEQKVWSFEFAPPEYKAMFPTTTLREGYRTFIVWERRHAPNYTYEWVTPDGTWWSLWHYVTEVQLDDVTTVYLLTEITRSS